MYPGIQRWASVGLQFLWLGGLMAGATFLQSARLHRLLQTPSLNTQQLEQQDRLTQVQLKSLLRLPSLGFDNLVGNWAFLQFLQYFGDSDARAQRGYRLTPDYFRVVIDRNPRFLEIYYYLTVGLTLYAGLPTESVALAAQGLQSMTPQIPYKSYYVWRNKGIDELLYLADDQAAVRSYTKAAEWADVYSDPQSQYDADFYRSSIENIEKYPLSNRAQAAAWAMVLSQVQDDKTRAMVIKQIEAQGGWVNISPNGGVSVTFPPKSSPRPPQDDRPPIQ